MPERELIEKIITYIRTRWESPSEPLDAQRDLIERFHRRDPEEFALFLEAFSRDFSVAIEDRIYVDRLTIRDLCELVRAGTWPKVVPPPANE